MPRITKLLPLMLLLVLSACAESIWASDEAVTKYSYSNNEPPSITLVTVINNNNGSGGHSALLINAHERVVFDPAGNFKSSWAPERNDFVYGMSPAVLKTYYGFHARTAWHVVTQKVIVTPEIAEMAFAATKNYGAVPKSMCSISVTNILSKIPGFESIPHTPFPKQAMNAFAKLPGVTTDKIYEYD
jgi:hypothetical protein